MSAAIMADFRLPPYFHQLKEFEVSADLPARALLWQMRTGKSKLVVDTTCHQAREKFIDAAVVFAPNGVHENWSRRELPKHHWESVPHRKLVWRTSVAGELGGTRVKAAEREEWQDQHDRWWSEAKSMLKDPGLVWFFFNSESVTRKDVRSLLRRIMKHRRVMAVFDESDDFRTPGSRRSKMIRPLAARAVSRRILTGTVVHNSPLAAWSQYELLEHGALGFDTYGDFKRHHAEYEITQNRKGNSYKVLKEYRNLDGLRDAMAPWSSVVLRSDCEDLPDVVHETRQITPSTEQLRLYRELHRAYTVDIGGVVASIGENTNRFIKLQQVLSGFLIDEFGDIHDIPGINPRLEAVSDEVYLAPGKVIVWCQFREDIRRVAERLRADGHKIVEYHGGVDDDGKTAARESFQDDDEVKGLVGQSQSGGRGLDLSAASEIIHYSHTFNAIIREQSDERGTEIGGENMRVLDFMGPGPDPYIRENVRNKVEIADALAGSGMKNLLGSIAL